MSKRRLLIVDDDEAVGDLIKRVGERQGFSTQVLLESERFQEVCEAFDPHVILLDVVMPNADGVELLRYLVERGTTARIIFVSGYGANYLATAERLGKAHGLSSIQTLTKPIDINELRDALAA